MVVVVVVVMLMMGVVVMLATAVLAVMMLLMVVVMFAGGGDSGGGGGVGVASKLFIEDGGNRALISESHDEKRKGLVALKFDCRCGVIVTA